MSSFEFVQVDRQGPITIVTLNRPEVMNALHYPAHQELDRVFDDFLADPDQWVAIVTGAGDRAFCAGNDLKYQAATGDLKAADNGFAGLTSRPSLDKPLIAAVNGVAMGGGFELALACDIVVASEKALFSLPEPRVGLVALGGGVHRLPRAIGLSRAMDLILTSRRVGAEEGKSLVFVSRVAAPEALLEEALAVAREICIASPMAIRATKEAVRRGLEGALDEALRDQMGYPAMEALFASNDFVEGPRAFSEKRPPQWRGR